MNKTQFNSNFRMVTLGVILLLSSCKKDPEDIIVNSTASKYTLEGTYSESKALSADQIWTIKGRVVFKSGTTLTIEPGTIIKAEGGTGTNASLIIIAKGAAINAEGNVNQPIVFTSVADPKQRSTLGYGMPDHWSGRRWCYSSSTPKDCRIERAFSICQLTKPEQPIKFVNVKK